MGLLTSSRFGYCADVVVNPSQTFQTIEGWGSSGFAVSYPGYSYQLLGPTITDLFNVEIVDTLTYDLGLTGTRIYDIGTRTDGQGTDLNGNCEVVDYAKFEPGPYADADAKNMARFRDDALAEGYQSLFYTSVSYSSIATSGKPWVLNDPGERAQQIWASALYWNQHYGLNISYAVVANEPGNPYSANIVRDDINALAPRLASHALATRIQFPEAENPGLGWVDFIAPLQNDPNIWPKVARLSYHLYGPSDPYRSYYRDFGKSKNIRTAQTEHDPATFDDLYSDLTLGGVSYWEASDSPSNTLQLDSGQTTFTPSVLYYPTRQVTHYVRPGAVRIGSFSNDPSINTLAFTANGAVTTILWNENPSAQTINVSGLTPGVYGLAQCKFNGSPYQELGTRTVGQTGMLTLVNIPGSSLSTLYPYVGPNHPPTITTWNANPGRVVSPQTSARLSVTATDTELDPLMFNWSVASQPAGGAATLATPNAATTVANGLTVPGTYVFNINVQDGVNTSSKQLYLLVGPNPPPILGEVGFRIAAPYYNELDWPSTPLHGHMALPLNSLILQANYADLMNAPVSGTWTLVSQPAGADASVSVSSNIFTSYRATVTNMNVVGDYTFKIVIGDTTHPNSTTAQVICTVQSADTPPVINSISAVPANLTLPVSTTQLSASISDSNGALLRQWWVVKSAPVGANPVFASQGAITTAVSNLLIPGAYIFTLRAFDDVSMTTQDQTVTVNPASGAPVITSAAKASVIAGTPFTYSVTATNSPSSFCAHGLPSDLSLNNGTIAGTPTEIGLWNILLGATNDNGTGNGNLALTVNFPAPVISSQLVADGLVNTAFTYSIAASNCPATYNAVGLPPGLAINGQTGVISGTPTTPGISNVTISATNGSGADNKTLTVAIYANPPAAPNITSMPTATGTVGTAFNYTITASNTPTRYFAIGLPSGLSFDTSSPNITGIPLVAGTFNVTIEASNIGATGSATLVLTIGSGTAAPTITTQPANQSVILGQTATFSVTASGTAPLSYRWQIKPSGSLNFSDIVGATSSSYVTPAAAVGDDGTLFRVIVTNSAGSVTSNNATLAVTVASVAPTITTQPTNQFVTVGQTATFSVTASGTAPLLYQWQNKPTGSSNFTDIPGAMLFSYTTPVTVLGRQQHIFSSRGDKLGRISDVGQCWSHRIRLQIDRASVSGKPDCWARSKNH